MGYESDLRKAMEYVFGSTMVCDTLDNAKKVAFDKHVMTKTVTLGGDIFDPQGTLSGGENITGSGVVFTHAHISSQSCGCCELSFYLCFPPPGARSQSASVLASLQELKDIRDELSNKESQLRDAERQLACLKGTADKYVDTRLHLTPQMGITGE